MVALSVTDWDFSFIERFCATIETEDNKVHTNCLFKEILVFERFA